MIRLKFIFLMVLSIIAGYLFGNIAYAIACVYSDSYDLQQISFWLVAIIPIFSSFIYSFENAE